MDQLARYQAITNLLTSRGTLTRDQVIEALAGQASPDEIGAALDEMVRGDDLARQHKQRLLGETTPDGQRCYTTPAGMVERERQARRTG